MTVTNSTSFETCRTPEEVKQYLQMVLTRPSGKKETTYVFRYTKIKYLIDMLKTGYMRLGPCADMNDDFETAVLKRHGVLRKLFYACFTKVDESLAMYKLYGIDQDSVIFRISYADLEKFITEDATDSGEKYAPFHNFRVLRDNKPVEGLTCQGKAFCTAVGYYDPRKNVIKSVTKENNNIHGPFIKPELAGKVKYSCWAYEDEIRLCGETSNPLSDNECLSIKVPNDFDSMISVILCPGFDKSKNRELLFELRMRGINYSDSVYDPIYSDFISSNPETKSNDESRKKTTGITEQINYPDTLEIANKEVTNFQETYKTLKAATEYLLMIYESVCKNPLDKDDLGYVLIDNTLKDYANKFSELAPFAMKESADLPDSEELKEISGLLTELSNSFYPYRNNKTNYLTYNEVKAFKKIKRLLRSE